MVTKKEAPAELDFNIPIEAPKTYRVSLGDKVYSIRRPKGSMVVYIGSRLRSIQKNVESTDEVMQELVKLLFLGKDADLVIARLADLDDPLDYDHILELTNTLFESITGDPTT